MQRLYCAAPGRSVCTHRHRRTRSDCHPARPGAPGRARGELAAAGLSHHSEGLAALDRQGHAVEGANRRSFLSAQRRRQALAGGTVMPQIIHAQGGIMPAPPTAQLRCGNRLRDASVPNRPMPVRRCVRTAGKGGCGSGWNVTDATGESGGGYAADGIPQDGAGRVRLAIVAAFYHPADEAFSFEALFTGMKRRGFIIFRDALRWRALFASAAWAT